MNNNSQRLAFLAPVSEFNILSSLVWDPYISTLNNLTSSVKIETTRIWWIRLRMINFFHLVPIAIFVSLRRFLKWEFEKESLDVVVVARIWKWSSLLEGKSRCSLSHHPSCYDTQGSPTSETPPSPSKPGQLSSLASRAPIHCKDSHRDGRHALHHLWRAFVPHSWRMPSATPYASCHRKHNISIFESYANEAKRMCMCDLRTWWVCHMSFAV